MKHAKPNLSLVETVQNLTAQERLVQKEMLELLHVVEEQRLYASLGYSSLFQFCQKELEMDEDKAYRLVMSLRLREPTATPPANRPRGGGGGARTPKPRRPKASSYAGSSRPKS